MFDAKRKREFYRSPLFKTLVDLAVPGGVARLALRHAACWQGIGEKLLAQGDLNGARLAYDKAKTLLLSVKDETMDDLDKKEKLAAIDAGMSQVRKRLQQLDDEMFAYRHSMAGDVLRLPSAPEAKAGSAGGHLASITYGDILLRQGKLSSALATFQQYEVVHGSLPRDAGEAVDGDRSRGTSSVRIIEVKERMSNLAKTYERIGEYLLQEGDPLGAEQAFSEAKVYFEHLATVEPDSQLWPWQVDRVSEKRNSALQKDQAVMELVHAGLASLVKVAADRPGPPLWSITLLEALQELALETYQEYVALAESMAVSERENMVWQYNLMLCQYVTSRELSSKQKFQEALDILKQAQAIGERLSAAEPGNELFREGSRRCHQAFFDVARCLTYF